MIITASLFAFSCKDKGKGNNTPDETAYAYCTEFYNVAFGNYGSFTLTASDNGELETNFDDLTLFTLGGAFSGLKIEYAVFSEENYSVTFTLSGALDNGDTGTIEGKGIIKGKSVKVNVPISPASASSESVIYDNVAEQKIELQLINACFNKTLSATDFVLSGASKNMAIKSVSTVNTVDDDGNDVLSQTASLTLTGSPDGTDYAYVEILASATTFNKPLNISLKTDFYGASVLNDHIDTFTLSDVVYVKANNVAFKKTIGKDDITLDGSLKNYAEIAEVEFINGEQLAIRLTFPYTFVNVNDSIGYIKFKANATDSGKEFSCSVIVASPEINYEIQINDKTVVMELTLDHEEWNLLSPYPFKVYYQDGTEILVSGIDIVNLDDYLSITFILPDNCQGLLYFEIEDAYDIIKDESSKQNVTIKTYFYI